MQKANKQEIRPSLKIVMKLLSHCTRIMVAVIVTSDPVSPIKPFECPNITLTCTVELSPAVDVQVTVNTVWTGPAGFESNTTAQ